MYLMYYYNLLNIFKFADDVTLVVPQFRDSSMKAEYKHVMEWSDSMKLTLNTKEN